MNGVNFNSNKYYLIAEKVRDIKLKSLKRRKKFTFEQMNKPVSFWIKEDRLLKEKGKEFTIVLRTKGCSWSLGETGGCSMCGYIQDANVEAVNPSYLKKQFDYALQSKLKEIESDNDNYIFKIFNSGSFFDDNEIPSEVRSHIYKNIELISNVKEVVVESRPEYITYEKLNEMNEFLTYKYIEVGIGLETVNNYIRNNYINKGVNYGDFLEAFRLCKENRIGVKSYLLFKPPFFTEQGAIDDCVNSIKTLTKLKVNTISINPMNIQKGTLVEYLWYHNRYRPPWFYSLFKSFKESISQEDLNRIRVISDPSGAGSKRGIHNCLKRECEASSIRSLKKFVMCQNLKELKERDHSCGCKIKYNLRKDFR